MIHATFVSRITLDKAWYNYLR